MTFLKDTYNYLANNTTTKYLIFFMILADVVFQLISSKLMITISAGDTSAIIYFLIIKASTTLVNQFVVGPLTSIVSYDVKRKFEQDAYIKYNRLTHQFKNRHPIGKFKEVLSNASNALWCIPDWGLYNFMNLIGVIVGVLYTFYLKNLMIQLLAVLLLFAVLHKLIVGKLQTNLTTIDKDTKKIVNGLRSKLDLFSVPFQFREFSPQIISNMANEITDKRQYIDNKWVNVINITRLFNMLIGVIISCLNMNDVGSFMLITLVMNQLSNAITNMTYFTTRYNQLHNDYTNYVDFWKKAEFIEEPAQLKIKQNLCVTDVNIKKGKFKIGWDKFDFNFFVGMKILVTGKTGSGKSTFMEALTGKIKGIELNIGNADNYYHKMSDMYQNIREKCHQVKLQLEITLKMNKIIT